MDMVFHPVDAIQNAFSFRDYSPDILIQRFLLIWRDSVFSVMGAEDDVIKYLAIAVHDMFILGNPYRVMFSFMPNPPVETGGYCRATPTELVHCGLFTGNSYGVGPMGVIIGQLLWSWFAGGYCFI